MTDGNRSWGQKTLGLFLVVMVALSVVAGGAVMASPADDLNYDGDDTAPNPYLDVDTMTIAEHPMSQGTSADAMAGYEDDNGDWVSNPAFAVNTTMDTASGDNVNPYSFDPAKIEAGFYGEFPRTGDDTSALDADEWSSDGSNGGSVSVSDSSIASGVDTVNVAVTGQSTAGDYATATYNNWTSELDSDESKRVLQLGGEVNSIDAGAYVSINITDESGDEKRVLIEPDRDVDGNVDVAANGTGTFTYQTKLSELDTVGGGEFNNIESIDVEVGDANADVDLSWVDLQKKTTVEFGEKRVENSDGDYEDFETHENSTGTVSVHDLGTLDAAYDSATLTDVSFPAVYEASMIQGDEGNDAAYLISWDDDAAESYPGFSTVLNVSYRLETVDAIDVSHSGMDLEFEQEYPSDRYITAGYAEGVSSSANLTDVSLTSQIGSLGSPGDTINFDSSVSSGNDYVATFEVKLTGDEEENVGSATSGGGAAPAGGGGGGGFIGFITSIPGMIITGILGIFGYRRVWG